MWMCVMTMIVGHGCARGFSVRWTFSRGRSLSSGFALAIRNSSISSTLITTAAGLALARRYAYGDGPGVHTRAVRVFLVVLSPLRYAFVIVITTTALLPPPPERVTQILPL